MATMKMSGCLALVAKMPQSDQDALLARLDQYQADGIPAERAQVMAANDMLAEIRAEREQLMSAIAEQHPDLLTVTRDQGFADDPSAADEALSFSRRRKPDPEKTVTAYKLFRVNEKNPGKLFPLFIGKNDPVEVGTWYDADDIPTKGFSARPGWHAGDLPRATHIGEKSRAGLTAPDRRPANQVWAEIEMAADVDWQPEANRRGTNAQGKVVAVKADIKDQIPEDGFYRYKTNPNMTGNWLIGGSIKVNRILSDAEVEAINSAAGAEDLPRKEPFDAERFGLKLSRQRTPLGFYSALAEGVEGIKTNAAPAAGWRDAIKGLVNKGQVKAEEVEWTGVNDWLELQQGRVTKAQVEDYLKQGGVQVEETVLDEVTTVATTLNRELQGTGYSVEADNIDNELVFIDPDDDLVEYSDLSPEAQAIVDRVLGGASDGQAKFASYTLPGGENYREVLLTLPAGDVMEARQKLTDFQREMREKYDVALAWREKATPQERAEGDRLMAAVEKADTKYRSSHWDQPNVLTHLRVKDRTDADGNRVLFVEEIQSDWGQEGKKKGFDKKVFDVLNNGNVVAPRVEDRAEADQIAAQYPNGEVRISSEPARVPSAPFVTKTEGWLNLALKRIMVMAAEGGYDKVAFVNGQQSADRYDLSKQISRVEVVDNVSGGASLASMEGPLGRGLLRAYDKSGSRVLSERIDGPEDIEKYVGKEVAQRLVDARPKQTTEAGMGARLRSLRGLDLKVGGEGMKAFYDKIVPTAVRALAKRLGGRVEMVSVPTTEGRRTMGVSGADVMYELGIPEDQRREYWANLEQEERDRLISEYRMRTVEPTPQPGLVITDEMRAKVGDGLPLFSRQRQTETPEFKRWFDDSKVVDKNGEPLVVYHGTKGDFSTFDIGRIGSAMGNTGFLGAGFYFTNNDMMAGSYARGRANASEGSNVMPVYLSLQNPLDISGARDRYGSFDGPLPDAVVDVINRALPSKVDGKISYGAAPVDVQDKLASAVESYPEVARQFTENLKAAGYDGVVFRGGYEIVAFSPTQIKSAIGNNGQFDLANPDITASRRRIFLERDEVGRPRLVAGAVVSDVIATVANNVLDKVSMKPISKDLGRAMRKMKLEIERAQNRAVEVASKLKDLPEDERQMISDVIEGELKAGVTPPRRVLELAASMQSIMSEQSAELVRLGMLSPEAAGRWDGKYLPRFYESKLGDETRQWMRAATALFRKQKTLQGIKGDSLKSRGLFQTVPVDELDQWTDNGWEVRDEGYRPGRDQTVQVWRDFTREERERMGEIRDAMFRFVMGYTKSQRDVALGRLYEKLAANVASRTALDGFVKVPDTKVEDTQARRYGALAGMYVPREVLDHLSAFDETMHNDLLRIYRKGLSMWKEGKTVLNPVAHANNVISNLTMAHFAGVSYWDIGKYAGTVRDLVKGSSLVDEARDAGLFGATFNRAELLDSMPEQLKALAQMSDSRLARGVDTVWNAMSFWLRKPLGKAYEAEDLFFRFLIYRDARKRGLDADDAVDFAQQYIFAYDDLPKGARVVRDLGLPFFGYTYKAVPALVSTALKYPWRFAAPAAVLYGLNAAMYAMAFGAAQGGDDDDWMEVLRRYVTDDDYRKKVAEFEAGERENLPPWMKGTTALQTPKAIRLGMDAATNLPLFLDVSRMVPGGDLFDAENNAGGAPILQPIMPSNPVLTTLFAMLGNRDMFTGKDVVNKLTDTSEEAATKRATWLWKQASPAIAVGNTHWDRALNAVANLSGEPVLGYTGIGRDGLPVQAGYALAQTAGIKVRPIDLETSERIAESQRQRVLRELEIEIQRINRLESKGAIAGEAAERERDRQQEKKDRVRQRLTVDGDPAR